MATFCISTALHAALLAGYFTNFSDGSRITEVSAEGAIVARLVAATPPNLSVDKSKEALNPSIDKSSAADSQSLQQKPTVMNETLLPRENPGVFGPTLIYVRALEIDKISELENEGYVEAELIITLGGRVAKFQVLDSDLPTNFIEIVSSAFQDASFQPATASGVPVISKYRFRAVFVNQNIQDIPDVQ